MRRSLSLKPYKIHGLIFYLLMALSIPLTSCRLLHREPQVQAPEPPDYLEVTAVGHPPAEVVEAQALRVTSSALQGPIVGEGRATLDTSVTETAERILLAQAAARRAALRTLQAAMGALPTTAGPTVSERLANNEAGRTALAALAETGAQVEMRLAQNTSIARAVLSATSVTQTLADPAVAGVPKFDEATRAAARASALQEAKAKLRAALLKLELTADAGSKSSGPPKTLEEALAANADARSQFDAMMFIINRPDESRDLPDGSTEVKIFFDRNRARALGAPAKRAWLRWPWKK